jgi:hypothetical protein
LPSSLSPSEQDVSSVERVLPPANATAPADDWHGAVAVVDAEHHGVAGFDRDAVYDDLAEGAQHVGGVVVAAGTGPGDDQDKVRRVGGVVGCGGDALGLVGLDWQRPDVAPGLAQHGAE